MDLFDRMDADDHEQVVHARDRATGLHAIVAIHSTRLGPALGGTRFRRYADEAAALDDVLRLARAMTYKMAVAGLDLGGGKAVILGDPLTDRTEPLIRAYARVVDSLGGRYLTAEDVGTTQADMDLIRQETPHVTGTSRSLGGSGDPSPATAVGVLQAIRAVAEHLWGSPVLTGRHVAVTGVGKVGSHLVGLLLEAGARVTAADVDPAAAQQAARLGAEAVPAEKVHAVDCDVLSPCALGGDLDADTIPDLRCEAVAGAANNQLAHPSCARLLVDAGVTYVPDYVANAGGVINIADELRGYDPDRAARAVAHIFDTTLEVLASAKADGITPLEAAERKAEQRLAAPPKETP